MWASQFLATTWSASKKIGGLYPLLPRGRCRVPQEKPSERRRIWDNVRAPGTDPPYTIGRRCDTADASLRRFDQAEAPRTSDRRRGWHRAPLRMFRSSKRPELQYLACSPPLPWLTRLGPVGQYRTNGKRQGCDAATRHISRISTRLADERLAGPLARFPIVPNRGRLY